jgi:hypothetical protein
MLTVLRDAAGAAEATLAEGHGIRSVLNAAVAEAYASVERTPLLLPRLREAGVVDSGGLGVAVVLEGLARGLDGEPLPLTIRATATARLDIAGLEHEGHGYCTEFVVAGPGIDRRALQEELASLGGESILVVGDARTVHVHVHLPDPGPGISAGVHYGEVTAVKVDNMQAQHEDWLRGLGGLEAGEPAAGGAALPAIGLVAVAPGEGFARTFRDLGAVALLQDEGAKTSAGELLRAARRAGTGHVFLLPNDRDVLMAAEQAAREEPGFITVLPSRSAPAGIAAAIAYWPEGDPEAAGKRMTSAMSGVRVVEVSRAVRNATVDGVTVSAGDAIALVDGLLIGRAQTLEGALLAGLAQAAGSGAEIVTLYLGKEAEPDAGTRVEALIRASHPGLAVEVVEGGQPRYPYVLGVE